MEGIVFFASLGHDVLSIDNSTEAIKLCQSNYKSFENYKIKFINDNVKSTLIDKAIEELIYIKKPKEIYFYSRFFLHAVSEETQNDFLCKLICLSKKIPIILFLEFRTIKDSTLSKETREHFRRYINPQTF